VVVIASVILGSCCSRGTRNPIAGLQALVSSQPGANGWFPVDLETFIVDFASTALLVDFYVAWFCKFLVLSGGKVLEFMEFE
jgi:hypothetical protein